MRVQQMRDLIQRFIDSTDPQRDVTLAAFGAVVIFGVVALSVEWWHAKAITPLWVQAFGILAGMVALGGPARAAVDKWRSTNGTKQDEPKGDQS